MIKLLLILTIILFFSCKKEPTFSDTILTGTEWRTTGSFVGTAYQGTEYWAYKFYPNMLFASAGKLIGLPVSTPVMLRYSLVGNTVTFHPPGNPQPFTGTLISDTVMHVKGYVYKKRQW